MSRKIFVAGGTGVVGRRVVPLLVAAGHHVIVNTRNPDAAHHVREIGAEPVTVDLLVPDLVAGALQDRDAVVNMATAIPTGGSAARRGGWAMNDRLRTDAATNLADATPAGARYIGESITFPYIDGGDAWIDESVDRTLNWTSASTEVAESAALRAGGGDSGVVLRFAMFWAQDSAHNDALLGAARRGLFPLPGPPEAYASWVHIDDAAAAVVAALDAPPGVYNVAEPDPARRHDHMRALAAAVGRRRMRGLPAVVAAIGGAPLEAMARSHRISSNALTEVTAWNPVQHVIEHW